MCIYACVCICGCGSYRHQRAVIKRLFAAKDELWLTVVVGRFGSFARRCFAANFLPCRKKKCQALECVECARVSSSLAAFGAFCYLQVAHTCICCCLCSFEIVFCLLFLANTFARWLLSVLSVRQHDLLLNWLSWHVRWLVVNYPQRNSKHVAYIFEFLCYPPLSSMWAFKLCTWWCDRTLTPKRNHATQTM